jgi:outer membrane immunogenic protein
MKKIALTAAALALTAGSALAADLPSQKGPPILPPPPPPPLWTGFYVGLNAGGTWANSNTTSVASFAGPCNVGFPGCAAVPNYSVTSAALGSFVVSNGNNGGFIGGGQIGYNYQFYNSFVVGIEADVQGIASSNSVSNTAGVLANPNFPTFPLVSFGAVSKSIDYIGTVRGRLGWLFTPTLLVYGTGGLAYGGVNVNTTITQGGLAAFGPNDLIPGFGGSAFSDTRVGWAAGGGVEWLFWPNWSAKVEYLYYDLGNITVANSPVTIVGGPTSGFPGTVFASSISQTTTRFDGHIVRAGLNYHFNWGAPPPVVAKY